MNAKETVFSAIDKKKTERLPATIFGGGVWTYEHYGEKPQELVKDPVRMSELFIEMADKIKSDIVYTGSGLNNCLPGALGGEVLWREVGAPDVTPIVSDIEDLKKLDLNGIDSDPVINNIRETLRIVAKAIGDRYVVTTTTWGPFILAGQLFGIENLMKGIFKKKDLVKALCEFTTEMVLRFYEPLIQDGTIQMISMADSLSSASLLSRKHFEEVGLPPVKTICSEMKSKGVRVLLHMCGEMSDRVDLIGTTGADIVSLDSMVDLKKAKVALDGRCVLAGNVSPTAVLLNGDQEMVRAAVIECIEKVVESGGYMSMPACDLPPTVSIENVKTFIDTARNYVLK